MNPPQIIVKPIDLVRVKVQDYAIRRVEGCLIYSNEKGDGQLTLLKKPNPDLGEENLIYSSMLNAKNRFCEAGYLMYK